MRCLLACVALSTAALANADECRALLAQVEAESVRARHSGYPAQARGWLERARRLRLRLAGAAAMARGEAPVVSVAVAAEGRVAEVAVRCKERPVHLVLVTSEPLRWRLRIAPGVRVAGVWVIGHPGQSVRGVPRAGRLGAPTFRDRDDPSFPGARDWIEEQLRCPVATVQVGRAIEVGPADPVWRDEQVTSDARALLWEARAPRRARMRYKLRDLRWEGVRRTDAGFAIGRWSVAGPLRLLETNLPRLPHRIRQAVLAPARDVAYVLIGADLVPIDLDTGLTQRPRSGVACICSDRDGGRLLAVGTPARPGLFSMSYETSRWQLVHGWGRVQPVAIAWDGARDRLYALERVTSGGFRLHAYSATGARVGVRELTVRTHRPIQAAVAGGYLMLTEMRSGPASLYVVDPATGRSVTHGVQRPRGDGTPLGAVARQAAWLELETEHASRAALRLADGEDVTVAFLRAHLCSRPVERDVARLIRDLGAADQARRDVAQILLRTCGELSELEAAFDEARDPEVRVRLRAVIARRGERIEVPERSLTAVRVLSWIDSPAALALLRDLARDGARPERARAARAALANARWSPRP